jgi:hypothetical protein
MLKSLLSILDTIEWSKKQSHATVPLKGQKYVYEMPACPHCRPPRDPWSRGGWSGGRPFLTNVVVFKRSAG